MDRVIFALGKFKNPASVSILLNFYLEHRPDYEVKIKWALKDIGESDKRSIEAALNSSQFEAARDEIEWVYKQLYTK